MEKDVLEDLLELISDDSRKGIKTTQTSRPGVCEIYNNISVNTDIS